MKMFRQSFIHSNMQRDVDKSFKSSTTQYRVNLLGERELQWNINLCILTLIQLCLSQRKMVMTFDKLIQIRLSDLNTSSAISEIFGDARLASAIYPYLGIISVIIVVSRDHRSS